MIEKSDSKWLSLATVPILGQAPRKYELKPRTQHLVPST